jgi:hypothetical protein
MGGVEAGEQPRQEVFGVAHHADGYHAGLPAAQPVHRVLGILQGAERPVDVGQENFAGRGEGRRAAIAAEQRQTDRLLQFFDLQGNCRRAQVQFGGRAAEAMMPRHQGKRPQLSKGRATHRKASVRLHVH